MGLTQIWNGSAWIPASKAKTWSGTAWKNLEDQFAWNGSVMVPLKVPVAQPTNYRVEWNSTTVNTVKWTDSITVGVVYDIYVATSVLADWTTGTKIGNGIVAGVQTLTHNKDATQQTKTMLYYGIVARSGAASATALVRGVPKFREAVDWLPSTIGPNDGAIQGLIHITSADVAKNIGISTTGAYTVDWGDGSAVQNVASNGIAFHSYVYSAMSNDAAGGQRQALMTIRPQAGQTLTGFTIDNASTRAPVELYFSTLTLSTLSLKPTSALNQIKYISFLGTTTLPTNNYTLNAQTALVGVFGQITALAFYQTFMGDTALKYFPDINIQGLSAYSLFDGCTALTTTEISAITLTTTTVTNFGRMFYGCNNVGFTTVPLFDTSKGTDFSYMFYNCNKLTSIPAFNTGAGIYFQYMFYGCNVLVTYGITSVSNGTNFQSIFYNNWALTTANIPAALTTGVGTGNGTNFANMFYGCSSVGFTTIPFIDTSKGTTFLAMFQGCNKLTSIPALNTGEGTTFGNMFDSCSVLPAMPITSVAKATSFAGMFYGCVALTSANIPAALTTGVGTGNGLSFNNMFQSCSNVGFTTVPLMDTSKGTGFISTFQGCNKLTTVPAWNMAAGTNFGTIFGACSALTSILATGIRFSISIASCATAMPTANINTFYTNLGTASGAQTVTVTGLTNQAASNKAIATAKGWTVA